MELLWYLDRASALVAYPALYMAVLTGIFYNTRTFGLLHEAARRVHIEVSVFATLVMLLHGLLGLVDSWVVVTGQVPAPNYSMAYFVGGVVVGVGALFVLLVAVLGFVDPRRFDRPWGPREVHAFAYAGFGFATIHTVAIGTDVGPMLRTLLLVSLGFLVYVLVLRGLVTAGLLDLTGTLEDAAES
jgi:hypothetical protein